MNESIITIRWEKNPDDGSTDISVNGDIDGRPHFREAFITSESLLHSEVLAKGKRVARVLENRRQ